MTESKKAWVEPELIVLVRSKPEEAVLATCKTGEGFTPGPSFSLGNCWSISECGDCDVRAAS